jgi:hypothetical protein
MSAEPLKVVFRYAWGLEERSVDPFPFLSVPLVDEFGS